MRLWPALALLPLASGCTPDPRDVRRAEARADREFAAATKGRVAGEPVNCLDSTRVNGPQVIAPNTLVYRDVQRVYTTRIEGCTYLDWNTIIVADLRSGTQMCRTDQFWTVQRGAPGIPGPRCRFQQFTPWEKQKG